MGDTIPRIRPGSGRDTFTKSRMAAARMSKGENHPSSADLTQRLAHWSLCCHPHTKAPKCHPRPYNQGSHQQTLTVIHFVQPCAFIPVYDRSICPPTPPTLTPLHRAYACSLCGGWRAGCASLRAMHATREQGISRAIPLSFQCYSTCRTHRSSFPSRHTQTIQADI